MRQENKLAEKIKGKDFIVTAEYLPTLDVGTSGIESCSKYFGKGITAVNVADNHYGIAVSSLAASVVLNQSGIEAIYQLVTRDRNRIALQSDLLGAALLGIKNVLCLSGYHQTLIGSPESVNVYDIDSIQLIALVKKLNQGQLLDGKEVEGGFSMLIGAVANPHLTPLEINIIRLNKKINAGANFIQTQAVFDVGTFEKWLKTASQKGLTEKAAFLASVLPLRSAVQAKELVEKHTDFNIPPTIIKRLESAGDDIAQRKEGVKIAGEIMKQLKSVPGLRGIHILSGGNESVVPELVTIVS
ncbi:MAG: methylenetetrahydrofolate reductase [Candidatus Ratteibacteria bacterium]|nr:methylenetetrahydrofolate reductase [Candidatus Ratteibacteria bacterium]